MKIPKLPVIAWAACVAACVGSVLYLSPGLPERVATHFGFSGMANGWMPRRFYTAFVILFCAGVSSLIIAICYAIRFFPSSTLNVPSPDYWRSPEHYREACDKILGHAFWFGALSALWIAFLNSFVVKANHHSPPVLDSRAMAVLTFAFLAGTLIWGLSLARHFRNPQRTAA